jgi:hypothetical protein
MCICSARGSHAPAQLPTTSQHPGAVLAAAPIAPGAPGAPLPPTLNSPPHHPPLQGANVHTALQHPRTFFEAAGNQRIESILNGTQGATLAGTPMDGWGTGKPKGCLGMHTGGRWQGRAHHRATSRLGMHSWTGIIHHSERTTTSRCSLDQFSMSRTAMTTHAHYTSATAVRSTCALDAHAQGCIAPSRCANLQQLSKPKATHPAPVLLPEETLLLHKGRPNGLSRPCTPLHRQHPTCLESPVLVYTWVIHPTRWPAHSPNKTKATLQGPVAQANLLAFGGAATCGMCVFASRSWKTNTCACVPAVRTRPSKCIAGCWDGVQSQEAPTGNGRVCVRRLPAPCVSSHLSAATHIGCCK